MGNIAFVCVGQFVVSAFFFAIGTTILAMIVSDPKIEKDWYLEAWIIGVVVYGITFVILCNR